MLFINNIGFFFNYILLVSSIWYF